MSDVATGYEFKRVPQHLSHSSLALYQKDREEFFLRYLAGLKPPKVPQTDYMSIGAAFDAYEKAALHSQLFGPGFDPQFEFTAIFETQVEEQNRDWAIEHGKYVFECYAKSGAHDDLLKLLQAAAEPPRFEFSVSGLVDEVPLTGKPDCRFVHESGAHVILDWKVKGYCSKHGASPSKGYALCRDGYPDGHKPSRSHNKEHNQYLAMTHRGLVVNQQWLELSNTDYATQLSLYGWLLGEKPGDEDVVVCIDEVVGKYMGPGVKPLLRVANHRGRVSRDYQLNLLRHAQQCWSEIQAGHIFTELSADENSARCEMLDATAIALQTDGSSREDWFNEVVRPERFK